MATADRVQLGLSAGRIRSDRLIELAYRLRAFGIVAALALLIVVTSVVQPRFLSGQEVNSSSSTRRSWRSSRWARRW